MRKLALVALPMAGIALAPMALMVLFAPPKMPSIALGGGGGQQECGVRPAPAGTDLDAVAVGRIAYTAGWREEDIAIAVAVAQAESGLRADATNDNTNGSIDYGLFQINSIHEAILATGTWSSPADNASMAFQVWTDAGKSWTPWVTYNTGSYRKFLKEVAVPLDCKPIPAVPNGACKGSPGPFGNGQIPARALCPLWADRDHRLRADAANGFDALAKAYEQALGSKPCITDSYRSYAAQVDVRRRKPGLAAVPGTSNHGWGLALDLCGPGGGPWVNGSDYDKWMQANGQRYGWDRPSWADPDGSKPESWHHEYEAAK